MGWRLGVHLLCGSEEQKTNVATTRWPAWRRSAAFGLTRAPLVGSGTVGFDYPAKRDGRQTWILNGQKKWIGNAPWCEPFKYLGARSGGTNQVQRLSSFENKTTPGLSVEKIENKIALRVDQRLIF